MLKPRKGKFSETGGLKHKMASPPNVLLGTFMLWWGWLGFNCGSTFGVSGGKWKLASRSAVCTLNASFGGGIFAHLFGLFYLKRVDIPTLMSGILGSLVSITAICAVVRPGESIFIGFVGSVIAICGWRLIERLKIDDPVGAISTHAGGAIWGMLAVGLFVEKDTLEGFSSDYGVLKGGSSKVIGVQLLAIISIGCWSAAIAFLQIYIIGRFVHFRFSDVEEMKGADWCEHGIDHDTERLVSTDTSETIETPDPMVGDGEEIKGAWDRQEDTEATSLDAHGKGRISRFLDRVTEVLESIPERFSSFARPSRVKDFKAEQ